ncbi:CDK5 regulatory subunit associated protein 1 [Mactra antiquata]
MFCFKTVGNSGSVLREVLKVPKSKVFRKCTTNASSTDVSKSLTGKSKARVQNGPSLEHFIANSNQKRPVIKAQQVPSAPFIKDEDLMGNGRSVYFDVHGCQMNTNDTEIAWSILHSKGYTRTLDVNNADVVLVMTCAIREGAETKIWKKLKHLTNIKRRRPLRKGGVRMKIGILGCMAERLKSQILEKEKLVDIVCGPDAYRDLPRLLATTDSHQNAINVLLSLEETYADVMPVRLNENAVTAYVSIMRGCDNMCAYCIVPFTRGRERSRPIDSIVDEVKMLSDQGVKEITLLGQNVNSYRDMSESNYYGVADRSQPSSLSDGFSTIYKTKSGGRRFDELLDKVSDVDKEMRIRFTAPHPKDFPDEVLYLIKERANICNQLHLPAQSGNNEVLAAMRRGYTVESYHKLVDRVRTILPDVGLTSDFICGFCGETDRAHQETLQLVKEVKYSMLFCYPYSMRQKTHAYHRLKDDVPDEVKTARHLELHSLFRDEALKYYTNLIGQYHTVLVEGYSKKKDKQTLFGRNDNGLPVVIPDIEIYDGSSNRHIQSGDYVVTKVTHVTSSTLYGEPLQITKLNGIVDDMQLQHSC